MPNEREIFGPFRVGGRDRYADPLQVRRRLSVATGGRLGKLLAQARATGPEDAPDDAPEVLAQKEARRALCEAEAFEAIEALRKATLWAFELPDFDPATGEGTRAGQAEAILARWFQYLAEEQRFFDSAPTSPPATGPASSPSLTGSSTPCG